MGYILPGLRAGVGSLKHLGEGRKKRKIVIDE
jgi:hypothetical protein